MAEFGNYYTVKCFKKEYKINKKKAMYVFSKLENREIKFLSSVEFEKYLKKYEMMDEEVLRNFERV